VNSIDRLTDGGYTFQKYPVSEEIPIVC